MFEYGSLAAPVAPLGSEDCALMRGTKLHLAMMIKAANIAPCAIPHAMHPLPILAQQPGRVDASAQIGKLGFRKIHLKRTSAVLSVV